MRPRFEILVGVAAAGAGIFIIPWHSSRSSEVALAPSSGTVAPAQLSPAEMSPPLSVDGQGADLAMAAITDRQIVANLPNSSDQPVNEVGAQAQLESHEAILVKLEKFLEFPSAYNGRVLQIESIIAIQRQKGAVMSPASNGEKVAPKGMASIHDDSRGVYFAPEEFPELRELRVLGDGERVPAALAAAIEFRAQEAIAALDH